MVGSWSVSPIPHFLPSAGDENLRNENNVRIENYRRLSRPLPSSWRSGLVEEVFTLLSGLVGNA
jgi:hypothetical protein